MGLTHRGIESRLFTIILGCLEMNEMDPPSPQLVFDTQPSVYFSCKLCERFTPPFITHVKSKRENVAQPQMQQQGSDFKSLCSTAGAHTS